MFPVIEGSNHVPLYFSYIYEKMFYGALLCAFYDEHDTKKMFLQQINGDR